jgi:4-hydroxy-4-methyl-2-oxoglutarate aldolase
VSPGDLVVADASGVVFLPAGQAEDIIAVAEDCVALETAMARRIRVEGAVSKL